MRRALPIPALLVTALLLHANPTGGDVAAGSASIAGQGSSVVTINQASHTAIINWQSFSIGSGELTKFIQPSATSAVLNRVSGGQTSFINGTLSANGQVFLINGNGIVVGANGVITTAGFTASTRDIADADFLSGNLHFLGGNDAGVRNLGTINALGGDVVLIGKTVDNKGAITATGTAGLVAGDDVLLAQKNDDGSTITVNPVSTPSVATGRVGVRNSGTIAASSAELKAANGNIYALAIQNEGLVRATTVTQQGGHIYLTADSGTIVNSGTLNASATAAKGHGGTILMKSKAGKVVHSGKIIDRGGKGGAGGNVEISGAQVAITGTVDTTAEDGTTGNLLLDPATINVITGGGTDPNGSTVDPTTIDSLLDSTGLTLSASNNITISSDISWDSGNNLALVTTTAGSTIDINAGITNSHATTGGLIINAAAATDVISTSINGTINVANFTLQRGAWKQLVNVGGNGGNIPQVLVNGSETSELPAFTATNDFEVGANATFLRADSGNGSTAYYGLEDVYGLQGMKGFLTSNFTLNGRTIDASGTSSWNSSTGFVPIGSADAPYTGNFDNGTIENLTINLSDSANVALFGVIGSGANIDNVSLYYFNVTGAANVGALAGDNGGFISGVYMFEGNITGGENVGGLVGKNESGGELDYDALYYTSVSGDSNVGGAAGYNDGNIYSFQNYFASITGQGETGGITGINDLDGTITLSTNSGSITGDDSNGGSDEIGGIAGENDGTITQSNTFPGATVTGHEDVGGLVGYNTGLISDSYNSASVTGTSAEEEDEGVGSQSIGGIAGENEGGETMRLDSSNQPVFIERIGTIQTSYNAGTVDGDQAVGGIVGQNDSEGTVTTCYNVGAIGDSDTFDAGGVVGDNYGLVANTYNSGFVQGSKAAGIIGFDEDGAETENSYWDIATSGQESPTNANIDEDEATEINLASVDSSTPTGTAYTISGNDPESGSGYGFFGNATAVAGTDGIYAIGTSPDAGGGAAWYIIDGQTRPMLAMEASGNVSSPHALQLMALNLGAGYDITSELDMSVTENPSDIWNSSGFDPIGSAANPFTGSVYGNYETIDGLFINRPTTDNVGLFGVTGSSAIIEYVTMDDSSITGQSNVGGIVGNNAGQVIYCQNNGDDFDESFDYEEDNPVAVTGTGDNIGGIVGLNEVNGEVSQDTNSGVVEGGESSAAIGGIAGSNEGYVEQDINSGAVGSGVEVEVGGLVGFNGTTGVIDNSYGDDNGYVSGAIDVGGLVGDNFGLLETSYSTSTVSGDDSASTGTLVGFNESSGQIDHVYAQVAEEQSVIGTNNGIVTDVAAYTRDQLADITNYAQGGSPGLWDFSPQNGEGGGVWGVNVYNYNGQINDGLPVLQWQYPVNAEVAVVGGTQNYGYAPTVTETGSGASQLAAELPNGPTFTVTGGNQAGDTQQIVVDGNPADYGFNIEYVNGTANLVPAPLDIVANSIVVASGQGIPSYTATYTGLQNGDTGEDLDGTLTFTIDPLPATAVGQHTITVTGQSSPNYVITFFSGILNVTTSNPTPSQIASTFTAEITNLQNQFGNDPFNGLDPNYFMTIPNQVTLAGDLFGAINNEPKKTDYAYASSTANLPAFSRLVTPGSGVVQIIDGVVVIGDPSTGKPVFLNQPGASLSQGALAGLRGVLSPSVYNELIALIHAQ